jgi:transcriptional regulator with XRE-family HTH domain
VAASAILREARARAGLSQRELAARARTSQARISRIENGREEPSHGLLEGLVAGCGLQLAYTLREPAAARVLRAAELSRVLTGIAIAARHAR